MKKLLIAMMLMIGSNAFCQDVTVLMKEASNLERSMKEGEAFQKYQQVILLDPTNIKALVKSSELASIMGGRLTDKKQRTEWLDKSKGYAEKALAADSVSVEALYALALVNDKYSETETENKKLVTYLRDMKKYADKAVAVKPDNGKANYILGKWNYNLVVMPWTKKAALKVLFGGMPDGNIDSVYTHMEKCRTAEPYFLPNFFYLAKAYKFDDKPAKAIELLNQVVKLPTRTSEDVALKAEGKTILSEMQ